MINRTTCVRCWLLAGGKLIWRKYLMLAAGEPDSESQRDGTWRDKNDAWQVGGSERNQTMLFAFGQAAVAIACP